MMKVKMYMVVHRGQASAFIATDMPQKPDHWDSQLVTFELDLPMDDLFKTGHDLGEIKGRVA